MSDWGLYAIILMSVFTQNQNQNQNPDKTRQDSPATLDWAIHLILTEYANT